MIAVEERWTGLCNRLAHFRGPVSASEAKERPRDAGAFFRRKEALNWPLRGRNSPLQIILR